MASLEEKQAYYEYGPSGWRYKQPPALDRFLERAIRDLGADSHGDPLWRWLWGGVAVVRSDPRTPHGTVLGDRAACKTAGGRLTPRHLHGRTARPVAHCYRAKAGGVVRVRRPEDVPAGATSWVETEYTDFGVLRWYVERKLTPEQLVEAGVYAPGSPDVPARGDYVAVLTVETDEGLYFEPTREYFEAVRAHLSEELNERPADLLARHRGAAAVLEARRERERDEAEVAELEEMVGRAAAGEPGPGNPRPRRRPPLVVTGDVASF